MLVQILQQEIDSAGNVGFILLSIQSLADISSTITYLQTLPTGQYIAQVVNGNDTTIIAQVQVP